ncbi:ATP-binding protein [Streptomyces sp. NPDC006553]|uniref:ATP-binding protein n=1 Tax=unclassified Streptomyces TaxID=2593676 RepID=UPI0022565FA1|nr:ATP-binding protein [Streptomyces sp. NBC_00233]MCX5231912.1 ATP-binding protein [Streptomyces sp. NBC_00233]
MSEPVRSRGQIRRLVLRSGESVVARCRDFCRVALADWDWPGSTEDTGLTEEERELAIEDVLLVVSEAVTNACLHAGGPTELVIRLAPAEQPGDGAESGAAARAAVGVAGDLRIEVSDRSSRIPDFRPRGAPGQPGGNGLRVIDRLAGAWGAVPGETGKSFWMEVAAPVPANGPQAAPQPPLPPAAPTSPAPHAPRAASGRGGPPWTVPGDPSSTPDGAAPGGGP